MIRFSILMIALFFGAYSQYNAGVKVETTEKIDAISKNIRSIMSQEINCADPCFNGNKAITNEHMDSLLSKTIYAELSKY